MIFVRATADMKRTLRYSRVILLPWGVTYRQPSNELGRDTRT